ncbi:MAG: aromatic acid exporter family protein [Lachnospiraceae bacterium]
MNEEKKHELKKLGILALKMAVGSSAAIYIATLWNLQFAASAGIIALLSLMTTKWGTVKLSIYRVITFLLSVLLSWISFQHITSNWLAYGSFILILVVISYLAGWKATISVNAVIGTHFLMVHDFSLSFIRNEFLLVFIGISIALLLNLFQNNNSAKQKIINNMRDTETQLQTILEELALYLSNQPMKRNVWDDLTKLEEKLFIFTGEAYEYQDNTFHSHPSYYIHYFEMRTMQCSVLHSLHDEMQKIRTLPDRASIIADYIRYLGGFVYELNDPKEQIQRLEELFEGMRSEEMPKTYEEFESQAKLYHVLMDLEEFLMYKRRFVESIDDRQRSIYWDVPK